LLLTFTLEIDAMLVWNTKFPLPAFVIVPSGTFPFAFRIVRIAVALVLVALTVNICVYLDHVALVTCKVSPGETVILALADVPCGAKAP